MKLSLKQIRLDTKLSPRIEQGTVEDVVKRYSECLEQLPPIIVFKVPDQSMYLLMDGWHRYRAAELLNLTEIEVETRYGSMEQAKEFALLANLRHGLPLTRKERRYIIAEFLKLHPERSNVWIAEDLGVSNNTVGKVRDELEAGLQLATLDVLVGKDGKEYPRTIQQPKLEASETEEKQEEVEQPPTDEPEPEPKPEPPSIPMLGIYELNKVHQVDCTEALMGLPETSIDLMFADPPYNLGKKYGKASTDNLPEEKYFNWCMQWFIGIYRVLKPGGAFYVMHYPETAARWKQQLDGLFTFQRWLSWVYPSNIGHSDSNWRRSHRTILYYTKGSHANYFDGNADAQTYRNPDDIRIKHLGKSGTTPYDWWEYDLVKNVSKEKQKWPNQLPLALVQRIITTSCPQDGIVCDPFMGSGTTALAAMNTERDWIGFDIESKACKIVMERIANV